MSLYPLALFLHVSGAIGTFVSLGIWLFGLAALRRSRQVHEPMLHISVFTLTTLLLGIVFLMTTKPSLLLSLLVMGIALILGLRTSLLFWATARRRARSASPDGHEVDPFLKQSLWTRRW